MRWRVTSWRACAASVRGYRCDVPPRTETRAPPQASREAATQGESGTSCEALRAGLRGEGGLDQAATLLPHREADGRLVLGAVERQGVSGGRAKGGGAGPDSRRTLPVPGSWRSLAEPCAHGVASPPARA